MATQGPTMVAVTDSTHARLLELTLTPQRSCHIEEVDEIHQPQDEYEHSRPSPRKGATGNTDDDHETEEQRRRFARRVTDWLSKRDELEGRPVVVFAPPQFRGALRQCDWGRLGDRVDMRDGDLTSLRNGELVKHDAIKDVMPRR